MSEQLARSLSAETAHFLRVTPFVQNNRLAPGLWNQPV